MGISPLSCKCFTNTFSQFGLYFHILTVFFVEHKCFNLLKSKLITFVLWNMLLVLCLKIIAKPRVSRFSLMLPSRSFKILPFTLRCVIYFELIFVKGIRSVSRFIFLHVDFQLF